VCGKIFEKKNGASAHFQKAHPMTVDEYIKEQKKLGSETQISEY
jgi:uncharacterized C2H2 Zn-finger protein